MAATGSSGNHSTHAISERLDSTFVSYFYHRYFIYEYVCSLSFAHRHNKIIQFISYGIHKPFVSFLPSHTHTNILYIWLLNSFMFKLDVNNINRSFFGGVCTRYGSYPWANLLSGRMMYHYGWMTFMIIFVVFIFFLEFLTFFIQLIFRVGDSNKFGSS